MRSNNIFRHIYLASLITLTLSGFGQMPIFKRYYIADIPGFGWLAEFYVTHYIHYSAAIVFLFAVFFMVTDFIATKRFKKILPIEAAKLILLAVITASGSILVIRNFPGKIFSDMMIITADITHLGGVMFLFILSIADRSEKAATLQS